MSIPTLPKCYNVILTYKYSIVKIELHTMRDTIVDTSFHLYMKPNQMSGNRECLGINPRQFHRVSSSAI